MKAAVFTCLLVLSPSFASAADKSEVDKEIDLGLNLREKGQDREALEHFQKAYEISHGPRALAQMALAEQALGIWLDAESHLLAALESKDDKWIRSHKPALEGALGVIQKRLGSLEILGNVPGAEVRVNGKTVGTLPFAKPVRALAGNAVVDVTKEGYHPLSLTVAVPQNGLARETVTLVAVPKVVEEAKATPPVPPQETKPQAQPPKEEPKAEARATAEPGGGGSDLSIWAYVAGGGAAAGVAVGVVELLVRNGHINKYNDDSMCLINGKTRGENCGGEKSAADTAQTISTVGFVAGGALAVASAVLFLVSPSADAERKLAALPRWSCGASASGIGVRCAGVLDF